MDIGSPLERYTVEVLKSSFAEVVQTDQAELMYIDRYT